MSTLGYVREGTFGFVYAYFLLLLFLWLPMAISRDMGRRGRTGWAYGLLTVVLFPVGVAAWLVDRRRFSVVS